MMSDREKSERYRQGMETRRSVLAMPGWTGPKRAKQPSTNRFRT